MPAISASSLLTDFSTSFCRGNSRGSSDCSTDAMSCSDSRPLANGRLAAPLRSSSDVDQSKLSTSRTSPSEKSGNGEMSSGLSARPYTFSTCLRLLNETVHAESCATNSTNSRQDLSVMMRSESSIISVTLRRNRWSLEFSYDSFVLYWSRNIHDSAGALWHSRWIALRTLSNHERFSSCEAYLQQNTQRAASPGHNTGDMNDSDGWMAHFCASACSRRKSLSLIVRETTQLKRWIVGILLHSARMRVRMRIAAESLRNVASPNAKQTDSMSCSGIAIVPVRACVRVRACVWSCTRMGSVPVSGTGFGSSFSGS